MGKLEPAPQVEPSGDIGFSNKTEAIKHWENELEKLCEKLDKLESKIDPTALKEIKELKKEIETIHVLLDWAR